MYIREYQCRAHETVQKPSAEGAETIVPLLGLASEVGELLNEYKKFCRDGEAHVRFRDRLAEELGDLLWYVAETATQFGLDLDEVAEINIAKTRARWGHIGDDQLTLGFKVRGFDDEFPPHERFPRCFMADFRQVIEQDATKIRVFVDDQQLGEDLTDNAHDPDGYRFHDVFHLACAAVLGWSPVTRRNLKINGVNLKRRSDPKTDEVEDGGRAIVTEEGISALVFAYASDHAAMQGVTSLDYDLLKSIRIMTSKFEVSRCSTGEWERAIIMGYCVWQEVEANQGGRVEVDLDKRSIRYIGKGY
jgi:NTP pyrophosphatase (non-canonical NTP hydrolase)